MSLARKNMLTLVIGAIVFITTIVVFFLLSYTKKQIDNLAFFTTLFAEAITIAGFMIFNKANNNSSKVLMSAGAYTSLLVYVFAVITCSVICLIFYRHAVNTYMIVQAIFLAILLISLIIIYVYGKTMSKDTDETATQIYALKTIESNVQLMRDNPANSNYKIPLSAICEALYSCDQSVFVKTDEFISERIYDLNQLLRDETTPPKKVLDMVEYIMQLINQRALEVKALKRGGI